MENNSNKISIIVLTYNHERYIRQCWIVFYTKSRYTIRNVISDDASSDNTVAILMEYQTCHTNIQVLKADTNQGIIKNFKKCLDACDGYYYATCGG
jgi:glycosyltransferase involved in cell wall biosynthesis